MSKFGNRLARLSLLALAGLWLLGSSVAADTDAKLVHLVVTVPANAKVYIDGVPTKAFGEVRKFVSNEPVPVGKKYSYKVKGVWPGPDGKDIVREVKFPVVPGIENTLDLTKAVEVPKPVVKLTVQSPAPLTVDAGTKKAVAIKIGRENLTDPIKLSLSGLPEGVKAADVTVPGDKSEGILDLEIAKDAKATDGNVALVAEGKGIKTTSMFKLIVKAAPPPPPPAKLTLEVPATFDLDAGSKKTLMIKIKRENFKGPVKLTFTGLPEPLKLSEVTIPEDKDFAPIELSVPATAKGATGKVKIKASSGKTEEEKETKVTIKAAPPPVKDKTEKPTDKPPEKSKDSK